MLSAPAIRGASNQIIAGADFEALSAEEMMFSSGPARFSLRWLMLHVIEETARHAGHADVLGEHLDGSMGYVPPLPE